MLRWRLIVEEFGPRFHYKPGSTNLVADALSRVPTTRSERERNEDKFLTKSDACLFTDDPELTECLLADPEFAECFLENPVFDEDGRNPFQFETLHHYQQQSAELLAMPDVFPDRFSRVESGQ